MTAATREHLAEPADHPEHGVSGIHPAGGENPEPRVALIAADCLFVKFGALPDRRDLDRAVGLEQIAVDQPSGAVTDEKLRPSPEEVLPSGIVYLGLCDRQDQKGSSMCRGSYVCQEHSGFESSRLMRRPFDRAAEPGCAGHRVEPA